MSPGGFNRSAARIGLFSVLAIGFLSITGRGQAQTVQDSMSRQIYDELGLVLARARKSS